MTGRVFAAAWIIWIAAFLAIEFTAIGTGRQQYTLSDFIWRLESLGRAWTVVRYFVAVFCVWLTCHMIWGWWR